MLEKTVFLPSMLQGSAKKIFVQAIGQSRRRHFRLLRLEMNSVEIFVIIPRSTYMGKSL